MTTNLTNWNDFVSTADESIIGWAAEQPWACAMAECEQDPLWHAEGDVWTHTKMVCDELLKMEVWKRLSRHTQLKLLFTALFHDTGKPRVTVLDPSSGRIRSPKHAQHSTRIARKSLIELGCDVNTREAICHLVLFHGRPPYLGDKGPADRELIKLSTYMDHRLMHLFALADSRGRICKEGSNKEDLLEMWRLIANENGCLDRAFLFANDHARFLFYRNRLENLHYEPHEDYRCKMTIMSGLPGSGKDTWLATHRPDLPVVSLDTIRQQMKVAPTDNQGVVIQTARESCRQYLRSKTDFALNATNISRQTRQLWCDLGGDYDARIELVYIEPEYSILMDQNSSRSDRGTKVPIAVMEKLLNKLEPPTQAECHELLMAVH